MITNDLFGPSPTYSPARLARRTDPATSHAAAARVAEFDANHHDLILAALKKHRAGLTVHEIASLCRLDAHQVGKRMKELETDHEVEQALTRGPNGYSPMTRTGPSGRAARVWKVVD